jgi:LysR family transcriptional regulator, regulator for metE and metH
MSITAVRLGPNGIPKQIFLGMRESDLDTRYLKDFIELARRLPAA